MFGSLAAIVLRSPTVASCARPRGSTAPGLPACGVHLPLHYRLPQSHFRWWKATDGFCEGRFTNGTGAGTLRNYASVETRVHDGAEGGFSGTYLTDVSVLERQEAALARMREQGFVLADVVRGFALSQRSPASMLAWCTRLPSRS